MRWLPADWRNSVSTLREMRRVSGPALPIGIDGLLSNGIPFAAGAAVAYALLPSMMAAKDQTMLAGLLAGTLAFGGLLVGFVVNLMLVTGQMPDARGLTLEEVRGYAQRIRYLLASQAVTLVAAVVMSLVSLAAMALIGADMQTAAVEHVGALLLGFFSVCVVRSFVLPLQIFEMHHAVLNDIERQKLEETNSRYRNQ